MKANQPNVPKFKVWPISVLVLPKSDASNARPVSMMQTKIAGVESSTLDSSCTSYSLAEKHLHLHFTHLLFSMMLLCLYRHQL